MDQRGRVGQCCSASLALGQIFACSPPSNDEILSSFLVRKAHRYGLSPYRFVRYLLSCDSVWARDVDSSLSADQLSIIARSFSLDEATVHSMTLCNLIGASSLADDKWRYCRSWVNSVGIYHRMRTNFGLQYCPICLQSEPVFCRHWRLSCAFACPRHGMFLQDCCVSCGAQIILHRTKIDISRCWRCGSSLCTVASGSPLVTAEVLSLQERLLACIDNHMVSVGNVLVPRELFIRGATIVMRIQKEYMHRHQWTRGASDDGLSVELRLLRVRARLRLFEMLMELMDDWPTNFLRFSLKANVTQVAVNRCGIVPNWMDAAVKQLQVRSHVRQSPNKAELIRYVRLLEDGDGTRCRSLRAQALMLAARGKYGH